ncbi:MAG TPA: pirin family protein [Pseudoxanthomonas sp.]
MITSRPAGERGHADHGWLDSWHSFSFAGYRDDDHVHWGPLRVINEDRIAAGRGFGEHGHRDMEIISYVLDGALGHKDSMGTRSSIVPGDVQRMSAGTGVQHSEYNYSESGQTHFLQIWIIPDTQGVAPSYAQKNFPADEKRGRLRLVVSPDGAEGSVGIHQDARMYAGLFDGEESAGLAIAEGRLAYVHLVRGEAMVNGHKLVTGDALLYADEASVEIAQGKDAEVLVFDLPRM